MKYDLIFSRRINWVNFSRDSHRFKVLLTADVSGTDSLPMITATDLFILWLLGLIVVINLDNSNIIKKIYNKNMIPVLFRTYKKWFNFNM